MAYYYCLEYIPKKNVCPSVYPIKRLITTIGSAPINDIHLRKLHEDIRYEIHMDNKEQATFIFKCDVHITFNGKDLNQNHQLRNGDSFEIAGRKFRFLRKMTHSLSANVQPSPSKMPVTTSCSHLPTRMRTSVTPSTSSTPTEKEASRPSSEGRQSMNNDLVVEKKSTRFRRNEKLEKSNEELIPRRITRSMSRKMEALVNSCDNKSENASTSTKQDTIVYRYIVVETIKPSKRRPVRRATEPSARRTRHSEKGVSVEAAIEKPAPKRRTTLKKKTRDEINENVNQIVEENTTRKRSLDFVIKTPKSTAVSNKKKRSKIFTADLEKSINLSSSLRNKSPGHKNGSETIPFETMKPSERRPVRRATEPSARRTRHSEKGVSVEAAIEKPAPKRRTTLKNKTRDEINENVNPIVQENSKRKRKVRFQYEDDQ